MGQRKSHADPAKNMCTHWPDPEGAVTQSARKRCERKQATEFDSVSQIQLTTLLPSSQNAELHPSEINKPISCSNATAIFSALFVYLQNNRKNLPN